MTYDHMKEAGLLSGEAAIDATGAAYVFKEITQRERPLEGNRNGDFFVGGSSFPSEHSAIAWSVASVLAHEYPGWLSQFAAYGAATAVTITRVTASQHFPADVVVGSALGWAFGRQVYRAHHDPELGGAPWGSPFDEQPTEKTRNPNYMASPYVPLDSWIYPAMERLIALGYMQSNMLGIRPWTRMQCARLLQDAGDRIDENSDFANSSQARSIYDALAKEFAKETQRLGGAANLDVSLDSIYTRFTGVSGTPLRDSYNLGETVANDYGRPYWNGFNNVTGVSAQAEAGLVAISFQGEYQHSPAVPSYSTAAQDAVGAANIRPPYPNGSDEFNRFQLLNSAILVNLNNVQISFGEQSAWMGTGEFSAWLMTNNAPPFPMFRIDDVQPHDIPGLSKILGPARGEFFIGQLDGHHWETCAVSSCKPYPGYPTVVGPNISPQPFIWGTKISFQPTPNFEFGMGITATFGGPGLPVTFGNFFRTFYAHSSTAADNPGKRISEADFSYRVPGLRNWLTFYFDSLVTDEISPIGSTRANVAPGIFLPHLPKLPKLQFRGEGFNESRTKEFTPGFVYSDNRRFLDGYTNDGILMGSWIGRAGRGMQTALTYWVNARDKVELGYRLQTVSPAFIEGGRLVDYSAKGEFMLRPEVSLAGLVQYEQWRFPVLGTSRQSDAVISVQLSFYPQFRSH